MAVATTPAEPTTITDPIAGWKHEIDQAHKDALWAIFGYDPADPKGSFDRLAAAWNRGHQPTLNLITVYEADAAYMNAQGARIARALNAIGLDLKRLLRGEYIR